MEAEEEVVRLEWEVLVLERKQFGEVIPERPYIRHQQLEPKIKIHIAEPRKGEDEESVCICGDVIPPLIMMNYYWVKSIWEGKRAGAKIYPT